MMMGPPTRNWNGGPTWQATVCCGGAQLEADPEFKPMIEGQEARMKSFAEASEKAKAEGKASPKKPGPGPTQLYNGMIAPLLPYAIAGAIWYQGESNSGRAKQYQKLTG